VCLLSRSIENGHGLVPGTQTGKLKQEFLVSLTCAVRSCRCTGCVVRAGVAKVAKGAWLRRLVVRADLPRCAKQQATRMKDDAKAASDVSGIAGISGVTCCALQK
jgi:hypothetical protein